ncbi:type-F conjugative transfer system pilin assembly protein TrbC [Chlamydiales bacterium]|nr:type-F conjugative transfer system pilin assembly protein TrbC [Chlamydiales bacterium]
MKGLFTPMLLLFIPAIYCVEDYHSYFEQKKTLLLEVHPSKELEELSSKVLHDSVEVKKNLDEYIRSKTNPDVSIENSKPCQFDLQKESDDILVFISFSMPDSSLFEISRDLQKVGGSFVLIGLPNHSFINFAQKVMDLRDKGINVEIQIDPKSFQKYQVKEVPTFVMKDGSSYDKIVGNISLDKALEISNFEGESRKSAHFLEKLRGGV